MTNPTTTGSPTLQQKLTVVKYLAKGRDLTFVQAAVSELTDEQIRLIATSHGYPDVDKMAKAQGALERQIDDQAKDLPPAPHREPLRDTHNANRVTGNVSTPAPAAVPPSPAQLTKPDEIRVLLNTAKQSDKKRIQNLANRIIDEVDRLRQAIKVDQEKAQAKQRAAEQREAKRREREAERERAREEVRQLEEQLKAARAKLRGHKNHPGGNGRATVLASPSSESRKPGGNSQSQAMKDRHAYNADFLDRHRTTWPEVRRWAADNGVDCPAKGMLPRAVLQAYDAAHTTTKGNAA